MKAGASSIKKQLLPDVTAGLVSGLMTVIFAISLAALIYSGELVTWFPLGLSQALISGVGLTLVISLTSSIHKVQAGPQDSPAAILALISAQIAQILSASASQQAVISTVLAGIALTTLSIGAVFLALGSLRLGNLVRFVPYPVIGGFLAGTGWLLVLGALGVMVGFSPSVYALGQLFEPEVLVLWLPGLLFALMLLALVRRFNRPWITPVFLIASILVFYGVLWLAGISVEQARAGGWLLEPVPSGNLGALPAALSLSQVDWGLLVKQFGQVLTIIMIGTISLLLNASGLEVALKQDVDFNRELRSAGLANLLTGLAAGLPGYHFIGDTTLAHKLGGKTRLVGLVSALICAIALLAGGAVISLIPKPVLGGLILFLGLSFLVEWLWDAWFRLPRLDYLLILVIVLCIAFIGFLQGVAIGVGIAMILFIVNYSRVQVVRHALSGLNFHSVVDRTPVERMILQEQGERIAILRLQGYLFFGTAYLLLNRVRQRLLDTSLPPLRFLVLDFKRVNGLDSSAVASFLRMQQLVESRETQLVLTQVSPGVRSQFELSGFGSTGSVRFFPTLDTGMEWCEDQLLSAELPPGGAVPPKLQVLLELEFFPPPFASQLMAYLEKISLAAGETLMRQGDSPDALYFVESGAATAQYQSGEGESIRLRTLHSGAVIGEVGFYLALARSASILVTEPGDFYRLPFASIEQMEQHNPELAAALHKGLASIMAQRLTENNQTLSALLD
jgi:SulP family sulfate permease